MRRIGSQIPKTVPQIGFRRFTPAYLVASDDPVSSACKGFYRSLPIIAAEILAMQQQHSLAIGRNNGRYVHVSHAHRLALHLKIQKLDWMRVGIRFKRNSERGHRLILTR